MRFVVIQFSSYLTEFRKYLLTTRYGVALRNLIYVKPDKKLYFLDNAAGEHCLSHPAWSSVTGQPDTFPPGTHTHDWTDVTGEPSTYPPTTHTHDWTDVTGEPATYPPTTHTHDWTDVTGEPSTYPPDAHSHPEKVKISATDTTPDYLKDKIIMGGYLGSQVLYSGGNEKLAIAAEMQRAVGEMVIWPTDTPPIYWLLCYGQAIDRTTYAALFNVIGTTYGNGNGSTTFNIPDMRGRFALGQDDMGGSSANRVTATQADNLGQSSGAETHTLSTGELPSHSHPMDVNYPSAFGSTNPNLPYLNSNTIYATKQTGASGGGSTHNNMPPYVTLNFIIFTGV